MAQGLNQNPDFYRSPYLNQKICSGTCKDRGMIAMALANDAVQYIAKMGGNMAKFDRSYYEHPPDQAISKRDLINLADSGEAHAIG
jgi:hypothetical protein